MHFTELPKIAIPVLLSLLVFASCNKEPDQDEALASITDEAAANETLPQTPPTEMSDDGWPHTTKKHPGELVFTMTDGSEKITDLGDDTVSQLVVTFKEMQYELYFVEHSNGVDVYQLNFVWTGESNKEQGRLGPIRFDGNEETSTQALEFGVFVIRPKPPIIQSPSET